MEIQTPKKVSKLNFNDLAFLTNKSTSEAKWDMANYLFSSDEELSENLTKSGIPKVSVNEYLDKSLFETRIKSCSRLDGLNSIDYIIKTYNNGITIDRLQKYSETPAFQKALKFTGKFTILNNILNKDQLLKLQKSWIYKNTYLIHNWSDNCISFIKENDWSVEFLKSKMIDENEIIKQLKNED